MDFNISLRFQPSQWFLGILAELNEQFSDWTDGTYDWAAQTTDFLHNPRPLPTFDAKVFDTPLSKRAIDDLLNVAVSLLSGQYLDVRRYLGAIRFVFVVGYPRSGGSYLTKELLRTVGLDHTRVSEALAHDGFPELRDTWYDWDGDKPYFHLQSAIFQAAEFLVISSLYYRIKTRRHPHGYWLAPKKMHKLVHWGGSFKMLLGHGGADYLVTVRHPLPTAISVFEKSGGLTNDGKFPALAPRSAIERWILNDLMLLGYRMEEIAAMDYFSAVRISWSHFHTKLATSGLFLGEREEIRLLPFGKTGLEDVVREYRARHITATPVEELYVHDKTNRFAGEVAAGDEAVEAMRRTWQGLGLSFPALSQA